MWSVIVVLHEEHTLASEAAQLCEGVWGRVWSQHLPGEVGHQAEVVWQLFCSVGKVIQCLREGGRTL